jgi:hypothetical protein
MLDSPQVTRRESFMKSGGSCHSEQIKESGALRGYCASRFEKKSALGGRRRFQRSCRSSGCKNIPNGTDIGLESTPNRFEIFIAWRFDLSLATDRQPSHSATPDSLIHLFADSVGFSSTQRNPMNTERCSGGEKSSWLREEIASSVESFQDAPRRRTLPFSIFSRHHS